MTPMMAAPAAPSASSHLPSVRRWMSGSRMTPRARDASTLPASNWGLTRMTRAPPGAHRLPHQDRYGPDHRDEGEIGGGHVDRNSRPPWPG